MAKQGADGAQAKKAFSSRLMQMKFMKRGQDQAAVATVTAVQEVADDAQWTAPDGGSRAGCRLIVEPDPPPGASSGHMAFGGYNSTASDRGQAGTPLPPPPQQQQQQHWDEEASRGGKRERETGSSNGRGDDPIVSDAELLRKMGHGSSMVKSMRMQKKAKRKSG